jgi:hypothetical protein
MNANYLTKNLVKVAALTVLAAGLVSAQSKEKLALEKEGIELIKQLEDVGNEIKYHGEHLEVFSRTPGISKWSHWHHLMEVKHLVNEGLQPALSRLVEIRPQLPEWKQPSIDKMLAAAKEMAADTNNALLASKSPAVPLMNAAYRDFVARVVQHADSLGKTADAAVDFAEAQLKADEAAKRIK